MIKRWMHMQGMAGVLAAWMGLTTNLAKGQESSDAQIEGQSKQVEQGHQDDSTQTLEQDSPVGVSLRINPDPSTIGDLLRLEVTVTYQAGITVNLPAGLKFEPLHLVAISESPVAATDSGFRKVFTLTLQHFNVGEAKVPGFALTYVTEDGRVETVQVPPHPFTVESLLANEAEPKRQTEDPPISLKYPNRWAEIVIYSTLAALAVGIAGTLLWNRLRRRERLVPVPPPIPAHEQAFASLRQLAEKQLIRQEQYAEYYLALTEITKAYLEGRFAIETLDRTTDEIRRSLDVFAAKITPLKPTEVIRFLQNCDLVKFARFTPSVEEAETALEKVRTMVESTIPKPVEQVEKPSTSAPTKEEAA